MSDSPSCCQACSQAEFQPHPIYELCRAKRFEDALQLCGDEIAARPAHAAGYRHMADVLELSHRYGEAVPYRNRVVELVPDLSTSYFSRAYLFYLMGDHGAAIEDFSRAAALDGDGTFGPLIFLYRADCHRHLRAYDDAVADCARVPDHFDFPGFLGQRAGSKWHLLAEIHRERNNI